MNILPSGLPDHVDDAEEIARLISFSNQVAASGCIKPSAFMPNPKTMDKSVFRYGATNLPAIWQAAKTHLPSSPIHGVAICLAKSVREAQLEVDASEPPDRHANIVNWPCLGTDPEADKAIWKERALVIASKATFHPV